MHRNELMQLTDEMQKHSYHWKKPFCLIIFIPALQAAALRYFLKVTLSTKIHNSRGYKNQMYNRGIFLQPVTIS